MITCSTTNPSRSILMLGRVLGAGLNKSIQSNSWVTRAAASGSAASEPETSDLVITERCVERLKSVAKNGEHLRIMVDGGGCSGFEYKFSLETEVKNDDRVFEKSGAKLVVDELSLDFMKGSTIDYGEELIKSSFRVTKNPLAEKGCSCGASFALRMD